MAEDGLRCMLHVVEGDAGNLHDAFCQLSMFFTPDAVDTDLLAFMQAFNATQVCSSVQESMGTQQCWQQCDYGKLRAYDQEDSRRAATGNSSVYVCSRQALLRQTVCPNMSSGQMTASRVGVLSVQVRR